MALTVNTNVASLNVQHNLGRASDALSTSITRLSSGMRIQRAQDDAAGLAIASRMASQINGMQQAQRNANDGISLSQTAEGAMNEVHTILQRGRELAVQAANGTYNDADRASLHAEWSQMADEIERVANTTAFNGQKLLDGSFSGALYQVGPNSGDIVAVGELAQMNATHLGRSDSASQGLRSIDLGTAQGAQQALEVLDAAIDQVSAQRASVGSLQNRFESSISNLSITVENMGAARSRITDADFAQEVATQARNDVLLQAKTAMLAQANSMPQSVLSLLR